MKIPHHLKHMDPNAILAEIKEMVGGEHDVETVYTTLLEQCAALDTWMEAGGGLPDAWKAAEWTVKQETRKKIAENFRKRAEEAEPYNRGHAATLRSLADEIEANDL